MAFVTIVLGESGTGKSTSLQNLNPENCTLINVNGKMLPFKPKGWVNRDSNAKTGNVFNTDNTDFICKVIRQTPSPIIIIDDSQYLMSNELMKRITNTESGNSAFQKYNEIARHMWDVFQVAITLPKPTRIYFLSHVATDDSGFKKIKTVGKLLDEKIVLEGLATMVLRTEVVNGNYFFSTKNNGMDTVKSPVGMFEEDLIPNDLALVDSKICEYYSIS